MESRVFEHGGDGAIELGQALIDATNGDDPEITYAYEIDSPIREKVSALARLVYNADNVQWSLPARRLLRQFEGRGWGNLPVCMAKTHLSISHRAALKGRPSDYTFEISNVRASVGAGFIYPIAGSMMTMPGLPGSPRALDVDEGGAILGL